MVRKACFKDIVFIEEIFRDAIEWMRTNNIPNKWTEDNTKWEVLAKDYEITDFYVACEGNIPVACMAITDLDLKYWPEVKKGESLYLHKLAVKREFAGKGYSLELIDYIKKCAESKGISVRLDCNAYREKLRAYYEKAGFKFVRYGGEKGEMALYLWS